MKPIKFKEVNKTWFKPASMTDEECGALPVFQDNKQIISCWKISLFEKIKLLFTGKIWLWNISQIQTPIALGCEHPFKIKK